MRELWAVVVVTSACALWACSAGGQCAGDGWLNEQSPLRRCGLATAEEFPQAGLCDAGFFPDFQISCGPPSVTDAGVDGGTVSTCDCFPTGPRTCLRLCGCDTQCAFGEVCEVRKVFWGDDTPTHTRGLCRPR